MRPSRAGTRLVTNSLRLHSPTPLLSKDLVTHLEVAWQYIASCILAGEPDTPLTQIEAHARQLVEEAAYDALAGARTRESTELPLASILRYERTPLDILEAVHQHLLSRRLHRRPNGELECRSTRGHRRAQGIYYTPDYIAEYLTERCLSSWNGTSPPRIFDPACGCGRFLLTAARQLLKRGHEPVDVAHALYGCDLDEEAVLTARRMLTLTLSRNPDSADVVNALETNITCTNSLIDIPPRLSSSPPSPASSLSSYDVILGNPPYRRELGTKALLDQIADSDFGRRYRAPRMDLWYYFLHRGIELLAPGGRLGFIVGAYWAAGTGANRLIQTLRETVHVEEIFQLDRLQVFPGVAGHHMMLLVSKPSSHLPTTVRIPVFDKPTDARPYVEGRREVHTFAKSPEQLFRQGLLDLEPPAEHLLELLSQFPTLGQLGRIRQGIAENPATVTRATNSKHGDLWQTGEGVFTLSPEELAGLELPPTEQELVRPYHDLCDLERYDRAEIPSRYLIYSTRETWPRENDHPALLKHLDQFRPIMEARRETRRGTRSWWQLHWPREARIWEQPKLIALQMGPRPAFVPAQEPTYVSFSANVFLPSPEVCEHLNYFAALLNSRLLWKWFRHHAKRRGVGLDINGHVLARAPIRRIDFASREDNALHDQLVELVNRMLELSLRRRVASQSEVKAEWCEIDGQIDRLVYRLYDLSDDDVARVEAACQES